MEDGVLLKFDQIQSDAFGIGVYVWRRITLSPTTIWQVQRNAKEPLNNWRTLISQTGCTTLDNIPQPNDEDLLDDFTVATPTFFGSCDDPQPVLNLRAQAYHTIAAAKLDYPALLDWVWPPY